jgi:hypothetical protein
MGYRVAYRGGGVVANNVGEKKFEPLRLQDTKRASWFDDRPCNLSYKIECLKSENDFQFKEIAWCLGVLVVQSLL